MSYKRIIITWLSICVGGVLISPSTLYAGDETQVTTKRSNSLYPGSWSIQFQIEDDIGLKPFNGKIISLKRHVSRTTAFRVGINLDLQNSDSDSDASSVYADTATVTNGSRREQNSQALQLNTLYMYYPNPDGSVNLFLGMGPLVRFSRGKSETETFQTISVSSTEYRERMTNWNRSWAVGAIGVGGLEWFATRGISFHAEYRAQFDYTSTRSTVDKIRFDVPTRIDKTEARTSAWNFDGVVVTMGLSIYF